MFFFPPSSVFALPPSVAKTSTMSPPSTLSSKRRLADQRSASLRKKKKKSCYPLENAFLREDSGYLPPYGLREHEAPARLATKQLPRPKNPNGRDPFQHLGDDVVHLIIINLAAKDTEMIRRVSQFWKATSEYHCGKATVIQHLPWAASQDLLGLTKEDINLQYRRQRMYLKDLRLTRLLLKAHSLTRAVYHYSSLELGIATRAIKFTGVYDWHMNENATAWTNGCDKAFIRVLKASNGVPISSEDEIADFGHQPSTEIPYVQLTRTGDLVVLHRSYHNQDVGVPALNDQSQHRCPPADDVLSKLTKGCESWQIHLKGTICKPAIGKDAVYFVEACPEGPLSGEHGPAFKKIDLATGAILYITTPPEIHETGVFVRHNRGDDTITPGNSKIQTPTRGRKIEVAMLDSSLKLAGDEALAVWSDVNLRIHIFSTAAGQILFTYNRDSSTTLAVSGIKPQIWDILARPSIPGIDSLRLSTYDPRTEAVTYAFSSPEIGSWRAHTEAPGFIDADRPLAFNFCHSIHMPFTDPNTRDPFTTIEVVGLEKTVVGEKIHLGKMVRPKKDPEDEEYRTLITLPPQPGKDTTRRLLEFEAPWTVGKDDHFGLVQGYLVYHNFEDKELIVIDFWPTW